MILVATTVPPFVMDQQDTWAAWLYTAEELRANSPEPVHFFVAIETDGRGIEPFKPLLDRICHLSDDGAARVGRDFWTFRFDDGAQQWTTANRLRRITMGQNMTRQYAIDNRATHLLFLAADMAPPPDALPKLLEMDYPLVGGEVTTYCLNGPDVKAHPVTSEPFGFPVQEHMATAAFVLLARDLFKKVPWRYDIQAGMTDDPCLHYDALQLGWPTLVRKDCVGRHYPEAIGAIETRGHDMRIVP